MRVSPESRRSCSYFTCLASHSRTVPCVSDNVIRRTRFLGSTLPQHRSVFQSNARLHRLCDACSHRCLKVSSLSRRPSWHLKHLLLHSFVPSSGTVFRNTVASTHESLSAQSLRCLSTSPKSGALRTVNCSVAVSLNCRKHWARTLPAPHPWCTTTTFEIVGKRTPNNSPLLMHRIAHHSQTAFLST